MLIKSKTLGVVLITIMLNINCMFSQENDRFWDDVQTIKKFDKIYKPIDNPIVFVGSSSIRMWYDAANVFATYKVINRGVGGTVVNDVIHYAQELIFDYNPRQVVIYVGENDLGDGTTPADTIFERTIKLFNIIRTKLPEVHISYISIKPGPGRDYARATLFKTNDLVKSYISTQRNMTFIDVSKRMLNKDGSYRTELFVSDKIHMTPEGYKIWVKAIKPYLKKNK